MGSRDRGAPPAFFKTAPRHRSRRPTHDELRLWAHAMRDVRLLPGVALPELEETETPAPTTTKRVSAPRKAETPAKPAPAKESKILDLEPGKADGIDRNTLDRLKKGRLAIEAKLDLHGLTQETAHVALTSFVTNSHALGRRCLLVITGKGGTGKGMGVLRQSVPRWLNEAPLRALILAIATAQPKDGGDGALYVLLKRRR